MLLTQDELHEAIQRSLEEEAGQSVAGLPVLTKPESSATIAGRTLAAIFGTSGKAGTVAQRRAAGGGVLCPHCGKVFPASCSC